MAQIITVDFEGKHNADLEATAARLTRDGAWKKQRVVQVIPSASTIPAKVYVSHRGLITPPNQPYVPLLVENAEVGAAYETALDIVLGNPTLREFEYLLTIEHDNTPPGDGLLKLIRHLEAHPEFAVISGLYYTKGEGGCAQIWGDITDPVINFRPQVPRPGELVECYGTGMGFALYRMSMFRELAERKVPRPWFKTVAGEHGVGTQDLYFYQHVARPNGFRCAVACDVLVGHLDPSTGIVW
jgi:hypothetical protein